MKEIALSKGLKSIVDDCDYEFLNQWKWYATPMGYAVRNKTVKGKRFLIRMHRVVAETPDGLETDHINMDRLDNRRSNLRICTHSENRMNRKKLSTNTSGFKGVYFRKERGKYEACIWLSGRKRIRLGLHLTPELAHKAYSEACIKYHGEFSRT